MLSKGLYSSGKSLRLKNILGHLCTNQDQFYADPVCVKGKTLCALPPLNAWLPIGLNLCRFECVISQSLQVSMCIATVVSGCYFFCIIFCTDL